MDERQDLAPGRPAGEGELERYGYDESLYRLATDTAVIVPVDKVIVMQVTGADVIHSWTIPAFGVKQDAVRLDADLRRGAGEAAEPEVPATPAKPAKSANRAKPAKSGK